MRRRPVPRSWTLAQRVEWYTHQTPTCWRWMGGTVHGGHGIITFHDQTLTAHRAAWIIAYGEIPHDRYVLHRCDEPSCVRPDHLYLGTQYDNMRDMMQRRR